MDEEYLERALGLAKRKVRTDSGLTRISDISAGYKMGTALRMYEKEFKEEASSTNDVRNVKKLSDEERVATTNALDTLLERAMSPQPDAPSGWEGYLGFRDFKSGSDVNVKAGKYVFIKKSQKLVCLAPGDVPTFMTDEDGVKKTVTSLISGFRSRYVDGKLDLTHVTKSLKKLNLL